MKVKELIKKLKKVEEIKPNSIIFLECEDGYFDFNGFDIDNQGNVELYVLKNDKEK